jgi:deoxycytidine triphosphate deaminase
MNKHKVGQLGQRAVRVEAILANSNRINRIVFAHLYRKRDYNGPLEASELDETRVSATRKVFKLLHRSEI